MPGGRPTLYQEDFPAKVIHYLENHEQLGDAVPTIEGLADFLETHRDSIYEWESLYPEFSDTLKRLRTKQGKLLQNGGLTGKYQQPITKLMLSANHGMAEKTENKNEHSGTVGFNLTDLLRKANG